MQENIFRGSGKEDGKKRCLESLTLAYVPLVAKIV